MEKLWRYTPLGGFTNKNAGFSMWCFGTYGGKEYFIKQFLSPKYPANDTESSPAKIERRLKECAEFEQRRGKLYASLTDLSDGNDVRILEFFRVDSRYYIATEKVEALPWEVADVAALDEKEKRRLCAIIAHAIAALHNGGMVHTDIKHDNILYTHSPSGDLTAKIIDFDGGFFEDNPPGIGESVTGDMNYFSPEVCVRAYGEERPLTCKLDVFALGVLFHQYFSGEFPDYDHNEASCVGEAVLQGLEVHVSEKIPADLAPMIRAMLAEDPEERPTTWEVFLTLRGPLAQCDVQPIVEEPVEETYHCIMCGAPIPVGQTICARCVENIRRMNPPARENPVPPNPPTFDPFRPAGDL